MPDYNHGEVDTRVVVYIQHEDSDVVIITPHAQRERGKVIDRGVHIYIYICLWSKKKI